MNRGIPILRQINPVNEINKRSEYFPFPRIESSKFQNIFSRNESNPTIEDNSILTEVKCALSEAKSINKKLIKLDMMSNLNLIKLKNKEFISKSDRISVNKGNEETNGRKENDTKLKKIVVVKEDIEKIEYPLEIKLGPIELRKLIFSDSIKTKKQIFMKFHKKHYSDEFISNIEKSIKSEDVSLLEVKKETIEKISPGVFFLLKISKI